MNLMFVENASYEDGFLADQNGRNEIRYSRIYLAKIARLDSNISKGRRGMRTKYSYYFLRLIGVHCINLIF